MNPFNSGITLFVDPDSPAKRDGDPLLSQIASQPKAYWYTGQFRKQKTAKRVSRQIKRQGDHTPILVIYNIPNRDLGKYSRGGASNGRAYLDFVKEFIEGIGDSKPVVVLEPDALASCQNMSSGKRMARIEMIKQATELLAGTNAYTYIDIGNPEYILDPVAAGNMLERVGVELVSGFSLNVSNFYATDICIPYGSEISESSGGSHFIIDTGRNGAGHISKDDWCNPPGRRLGIFPTMITDHPKCDAYLWIKPPGESDGECNGGPAPGIFWKEYALELCGFPRDQRRLPYNLTDTTSTSELK
jgi:endoglucanase